MAAPRAAIAVRDEAGGGEETLLLPLPELALLTRPGPSGEVLHVRVEAHAKSTPAGRVAAVLQDRLAKSQRATVELEGAADVATGHVLAVLGIARAAGAKRVVVRLLADVPDRGTSPQAYAKTHPVAAPGFSIQVNGETVAGE